MCYTAASNGQMDLINRRDEARSLETTNSVIKFMQEKSLHFTEGKNELKSCGNALKQLAKQNTKNIIEQAPNLSLYH